MLWLSDDPVGLGWGYGIRLAFFMGIKTIKFFKNLLKKNGTMVTQVDVVTHSEEERDHGDAGGCRDPWSSW